MNAHEPHQARILLVDDEALIALSEKKILEKHGYEVVTAYSGETAVETATQDTAINLVLMDIDLASGIDGTEAAEQILEERSLPIVFLTSHSEKEYVDRVKKITGYGYVLKNSGEFVLNESINTAFELFHSHQQLKAKEEQLALAMDAEDHGYWDWNLDTNEVYFSPKYCEMLGYEPGELHPYQQTWEELLHPDDKEYAIETVREAVRRVGEFELEFRLRTKSGDWQWIKGKGNSYLVDQDGVPHRVVGTHEDISERKQAEKRLHESEQKYKSLFDESPVSITIHDKDTGEVVDANDIAVRAYGFEGIAELKENNFWMDPPYSFNEALGWIHRAANEGLQRFEWKNRNIAGEVFWEDVTLRLITINGVGRVLSTAIDITERKRTEDALQESRKQLEVIFNSARDAIFIMDFEGKVLEANDTACERLGYSKSELLTMTAWDIDNSLQEQTVSGIVEQLRRGESVYFEGEHVTKTGETFPVDVGVVHIDYYGAPALLGIARDISERKNAEAALEEERTLLQNVVYNVPGNLFVKDRQGRFITASAHNISVLRVDTVDEVIGKTDFDFFPTDYAEKTYASEQAVIATGEPVFEEENRIIDKAGAPRWYLVSRLPLVDNSGTIKGIIGIGHDITESREERDELRATVKQKEFLMRELNHRVKNNLSLVASLINLKESALGEELDLSDLRNQVKAIEKVHHALQDSDDITHINLKSHVADILSGVFNSSMGHDVTIENRLPDISVRTKTALPVGLVINETATNALQHGFAGEEEAQQHRFTVAMEEDASGENYILTISNTGRPLPAEADLENSRGLGLQLVSALVHQLQGTLELQRTPRPVFTIRFPVSRA